MVPHGVPTWNQFRDFFADLRALEILRSLKTAMESPEPAAQLPGVAARATALRSRVDVLKREEVALRQRYGLTH